MPFEQLISALVESSLNSLISKSAQTPAALKKLNGKRLSVSVLQLPLNLVFCFQDGAVTALMGEHENDCHIEVSMFELDKLRDTSQLTRLIKQEQLTIDGDLKVAQNFSSLINELNTDLGHTLSHFIGDVPAHKVERTVTVANKSFKNQLETLQSQLGNYVTNEKRIAVHPLEIEDFSDQVNQLRSAVSRLDTRMTKVLKAMENSK